MDLNEMMKGLIAQQRPKIQRGLDLAGTAAKRGLGMIGEDAGTAAKYMADPRMAGIGLGPEAAVMGKGLGLVGAMLKPLGEVAAAGKAGNKYTNWLEQATMRMQQEGYGQQILDELDEVGKSPQKVISEFWKETYPHLPEEAKERFHKYVNRLTGHSPGSVIAVGPKGEHIIGKSWDEIYPASEAPDAAEYLEGTERGLVALMEIGNQRRAAQGQAAKISPRALPEE